MKQWKPEGFHPELPSPDDGCAFVLGGSMNGEIVQEKPLPAYFRAVAPTQLDPRKFATSGVIETYRLQKFLCGDPHQTLWFYIHEGEETGELLIRAFHSLCMFKREAKEGRLAR